GRTGVMPGARRAAGRPRGKYTRGSKDDGPRRAEYMQLLALDESNRAIAAALDQVADRLGASSSQVALAWVMSRGVIPIVGATRPEQMQENLAACDLTLDAATLTELDAISDFER